MHRKQRWGKMGKRHEMLQMINVPKRRRNGGKGTGCQRSGARKRGNRGTSKMERRRGKTGGRVATRHGMGGRMCRIDASLRRKKSRGREDRG